MMTTVEAIFLLRGVLYVECQLNGAQIWPKPLLLVMVEGRCADIIVQCAESIADIDNISMAHID